MMPGVSKIKERFKARIERYGKRIHLGCFDTEAEAYEAYRLKREEFDIEEGKTPMPAAPQIYGSDLATGIKCSICGGVLTGTNRRFGVHKWCVRGSIDNKDETQVIAQKCNKVIAECKKKMRSKMKMWNVSMGKEELIKMFPDMIERI